MEVDNKEAAAEPKFEIRGFNKEAPEEEVAEVSAEEADALAAAMQGAPPVADDEGAMLAEGEDGQPAVAAAAPKAKIKIGDREFESQDEAFAYAAELDREKLANDAFRHGVEAAQRQPQGNPTTETQAPSETENFDQEFYANPQEYLKRFAKQITEQAEARIHSGLSAKERNRQTWDNFYSDYPDLQKANTLVQAVLQREWENVKLLETKAALKIIAEKVRTEKREMGLADAPGTQLPRVRTPTSPGNGAQVTSPRADEKLLNFTSQMKNLRAKRAASLRK